jgi:hypothetical protein
MYEKKLEVFAAEKGLSVEEMMLQLRNAHGSDRASRSFLNLLIAKTEYEEFVAMMMYVVEEMEAEGRFEGQVMAST